MFYYLLTKKGKILFNLKHMLKISVEGNKIYFITDQPHAANLYAPKGQYVYEFDTEEDALKEFEKIQKKVEQLR